MRDAAQRALAFWIKHDPQNQWWWMQIGVPRAVAKCLLLLDNASLTSAAAPLLSRTPLGNTAWSGCNRVWGASFHVLLGAIESNATRVGMAYEMAHTTLLVGSQPEDGIQEDGSFHQCVFHSLLV